MPRGTVAFGYRGLGGVGGGHLALLAVCLPGPPPLFISFFSVCA